MSRRTLVAPLFASLLALLLASTSLAAPTLPGINARWDACLADGGVMNKNFACNTNTGSELIVLSAQLETEMADINGMEIRISFKASEPTLPAWWHFFNTGTCRLTSLAFIASPLLDPVNCVDWGQGLQVGGIGRYTIDELGPGSAVLLIAAAVPSSGVTQFDAVTEYIVGALRINHAKTVGTGSCGGCDVPVCLLFTSLTISAQVFANNRLFTQGANGVESQIVHWQNGQLRNLVNQCTSTHNCTTQFDCVTSPTTARQSTWGAVKALYR